MNRLGMFPAPTCDARTDAIRQLRRAMAGPGLTLDKLATMPAVLELPVIRRATAGVQVEQHLLAAHQAITDALASTGGGVRRRVLAVALGIGYAGDGTAARSSAERPDGGRPRPRRFSASAHNRAGGSLV